MIIPTVPLSKIAKPISRPVDVLPGTSYRTIGVKWWGEGAYERETIDGSQTAAKTLSIVREGDLIINKIWVRHGSTAIAGKDVDGCAASGEFPTFALDLTEVLPRWLHWQTKTKEFWEKCNRLSQGTSGKNRIKPDLFLSIQIPLPPLEEQRRIVARVEELAGKIEEARSLRQQALEEIEALRVSSAKAVFTELAKTNIQPLRELVTVQGGGTPSKRNPLFWEGSIPWISPKDMKIREIYDSLNHISKEATLKTPAKLIEPNSVLIVVRGMILAHTVPLAVLRVPAAINQDMKALVPSEQITPKYLSSVLWGLNYLLLELIEKSSHDTRKLETPKLLNFKIPVPPIPEQHRIVAYLENFQVKVDEMKRLRQQAMKELDAMLPSILDKAFKGEL
jgi:type I restriction enzyme S subunit